ncbi:MAG: hypothetical protein VR72_03750 [Clostridiaceae bacterium BRH_c20a]|nr:MAG: hypothetical protein VR72_03750 [Clostridiaceae bacterium BRH_c20a]
MNILLGILTAIIAIIFMLIILLLFIPISYKLLVGYKEKMYLHTQIESEKLYQFNIRYKQGSINFSPSILGFSFTFDTQKENKKEKTSSSKKNSAKTTHRFRDILDNSDLLKSAFHTVIAIINIVKPKELVFNGSVGFADPYNTGMLLGMVAVLDSMNEAFIINVTPLWDEEYFEGEIHLAGRFVLAIILFKIIKLLLSRPSIKFWRYLRKNKMQNSCNLSS